MDDSFFIYLEQLELMIFFSGYALVYLVIQFVADTAPVKKLFKRDIGSLLPFAYAFIGLLFLGLQLKNLYPDYSFEHIKSATVAPWLKLWGLLSILFFIPLFSKRPVYSLLHSLVFFFFLVRDIWLNLSKQADISMIKNDMNIYTYSLLLNAAAVVFILIFVFLKNKIRDSKKTL